MKRNTLLTVFASVLASLFFCGALDAAEFLYNGDNGPGYWAELDPAWEACAGEGADARQSPIDINYVVIDPTLEPLELDLKETPIDLINNGHAIEQEYEEGSTLIFEGVEYELKQFHFHTFSEHTVGGQRGAMELHAVFDDIEGNSAVIGMLFSIGSENPFLQELIDAGLPEKEGDVTTDGDINLADGLTETSSYYTYLGSLTTPPCSETVTWIVLKKNAKMSEDQFQEFRHILGNDFRPLQERNDREVRATARRGKGRAH
jgi:carbonic anhydrase